MKSFRQHIHENTTGNMLYLAPQGANFAVDQVDIDFDVEDYSAEDRKKMKPWEVRNAEDATTRRTHLLKWMQAVSSFKKEAVNGNSLPLTPAWQSRKR